MDAAINTAAVGLPESGGPKASVSRFFVFLAIVATLSVARPVLAPLALAALGSFILAPLAGVLERAGARRGGAIAVIGIGAFAALCSIGYAVVTQLLDLSAKLADYAGSISTKIANLRTTGAGALRGVERLVEAINQAVRPAAESGTPALVVPEPPSPFHRAIETLGPALEPVTMVFVVLVFVLFILARREDLRDRLVRLGGRRRIRLTTRTLDEVALRISRFLLMQLAISTGVGILVSIGLAFIGVPYALLWGSLTVVLRFIPYVGAFAAMLQPAILAFALFPGWREVVLTMGLFLVLELTAAYIVEPVAIGGRTGVSSLALLVSALFWTWLWGPLGLVLSTPIAVCLMVAGKHVPELEVFSVLLSDEPPLDRAMMFYQRLVAGDEDDAHEIFLTALEQSPPDVVCDQTLVPALLMADRDRLKGEIGTEEYRSMFGAVRGMLEGWPEVSASARGEGQTPSPEPSVDLTVVVVAARTTADELISEMVARALAPPATVTTVSSAVLAGELIAQIGSLRPDFVCVTTAPPGGLVQSTYICKRVRKAHPSTRLAVLRAEYGSGDGTDPVAVPRLKAAGADVVVATCAELRRLVGAAARNPEGMRPPERLAEPEAALVAPQALPAAPSLDP